MHRKSKEFESGELRGIDAQMEVEDKFTKVEAKDVSTTNGKYKLVKEIRGFYDVYLIKIVVLLFMH